MGTLHSKYGRARGVVQKQQGVWYVPGKERSVETGVGRHKRGGNGGCGKDGRGANESEPLGCGEFTLDPRMTPKCQCYSDSHS